jgi:hypothetical protein
MMAAIGNVALYVAVSIAILGGLTAGIKEAWRKGR